MLKALLPSLAALIAATALTGCATHPTRTAAATPPAPNCVKETGTRIQAPDDKCANLPGAAYSQDDLQRTGEIDTAAALRKLDPRIH
jgi:hypothetical protein